MKKKREGREKRRNGKKLASMHVLHLSIYFCIEGEQRIDDREREKQKERDSTTLQPTLRAHHHIIQFASVLTRSSNSTSYSRGNKSG
jgi:hypothetical protein